MSTVVSTTPRRTTVTRIATLSGVAGLGAITLCVLLMLIGPTREAMLPAYLVAYTFWFGIALGGLMLTMVHLLSGGGWGLLVRRPLESAALVLIPLFVLFLPILLPMLFGVDLLYPWTRAEDPYMHVIQEKTAFLNVPGFAIRTLVYFGLWIGLAIIMNVGSSRQDRTTDRRITHILAQFAGPGLALSFLAGTFAGIDWMMSREPDWYSSIYGAMLLMGWGLCTWSSMVIVTTLMRKDPEVATVARPALYNDLGNLMLAFTILWAYMSFVQYFIIWAGNLTEEIPWYLRRTKGGWWYVMTTLIVCHFFLPLLLLFMKNLKRRPETLSLIAAGILLVHILDLTWLIVPSGVRDPIDPRVAEIPWGTIVLIPLALVGIGGICLATFLTILKSRPFVAKNDPSIDRLPAILYKEALEAEFDDDADLVGLPTAHVATGG